MKIFSLQSTVYRLCGRAASCTVYPLFIWYCQNNRLTFLIGPLTKSSYKKVWNSQWMSCICIFLKFCLQWTPELAISFWWWISRKLKIPMAMPSWVATVIDFQNNFPWPYLFGWLWQLGCLEYSHAFPMPQKLIQNNKHEVSLDTSLLFSKWLFFQTSLVI